MGENKRFDYCFPLCAILLVGIRSAAAQKTIKDAIAYRPELSLIYSYMKLTSLFQQLGQTNTNYTFFAPHNNAFLNVSEQTRGLFRTAQTSPSATQQVSTILQYHTASGKRYTSEATASRDVAIPSLADGLPKLFMVTSDGETYINGARFLSRDLDSSANVTNGVLHIIDRIFMEPKYGMNAYNFITQQDSTSEYEIILSYYYLATVGRQIIPTGNLNAKDDLLNNDNRFQTVFVPTNAAIQCIKQINSGLRYSAITSGGDWQLLQRIVESHIVSNKPYHSFILETMILNGEFAPAVQGNVRAYRLNGALYVSNNCVHSNVTVSNITVTNGAVYLIDNVFGFVYFDMYQQIQQDPAYLSDLFGVVISAPSEVRDLMQVSTSITGDVPTSMKITLFAPTTVAFGSFNDFADDPTTKGQQLLQHMLSGEVDIFRMTNGTVIPTLRTGYSAKFYQFGDARYVEVDYVRARIVTADVCVRNGIIHKVDYILGVPGRTIFGEVSNNPQLNDLEDVLVQTNLTSALDSTLSTYTLFAPISFSQMRQTSLGVSLLDTRQMASRLKNLMLRHVIDGNTFLDQLPSNVNQIKAIYDTVTVTKDSDGEYYVLIGTIKIHVARPNIRTQNGVVHIIDQVIFDLTDPTDLTSVSATSWTHTTSPVSAWTHTMSSISAASWTHNMSPGWSLMNRLSAVCALLPILRRLQFAL